MKKYFVLVAFAAFFCGVKVKAGLLDDQAKVLTDFKSKYNNSQSDIIFLMDVSGSVSNYGFASEKIFVENLLNEFSMAPYSTRVAVITFGAEVKTDINYIDIDPASTTHQKCEFKPWFQYNVVHRYGWATNMHDAFQRSSDLLQTAMNNNHRRSSVHTVGILITDGYWNRGDPRANANTLKSTYGVDVIAVGVDGYSQWQLEALASSADHVLGYSTFTKFRELAMYIRGDAHDVRFMPVDNNKCTSSNGCDGNAFCSCGTVSGVYQCVCNRGYYGSGLPNHCYPCPYGTYKTYADPDNCVACPAHATTDQQGSLFISQCRCNTGYEGNPDQGNDCTAVQCEQLLAPVNGGFKAACGHVYDSVCEFQCSTGYNLVGSSSRRCQSDKTWSGTAVQCQIITCSVLPLQAHGTKTCTGNGYEYGNTCTFTCDVGYERSGSATRTCQADGQWSGTATTCEARQCPALRQLAFGTVEPVDCVTTPQPYQRGCIMKCVVGYVMTGDSPLTCGADGTWTGTFPTCEDQQPPTITCPSNINNGTDPERPTRTVTWSDPVVTDNSEVHDPNAAPTVVRSPSNIVSPYDFPTGTTTITYTATDRSNNSQSCVFTVTVADNEPPVIYCPQNQEVKKESSTPTIKVYWSMPTYRDNSGKAVTIFTESINGSDFRTGSYPIKYEATDHVGNKASCTFIIVVSSVKCKPYDPPINGLVACAQSDAIGGEACTPQCNSKKEFARIPAAFYVCLSSGTWYIWDSRPTVSREMPWPDCTEEYVPGAARKGMEWQYFTGDCQNATVQQQAKQNFIIGFNEQFAPGDPDYCQREKICALENIKIECGKVQRRKRRNAQAVITITLDVSVTTQNSDFSQAKSSLEGNVTKAKSSSSMSTIKVSDSQTMTLNTVTDTPTYGVCIDGAVFGLNKDYDWLTGNDHSQKCQNCPSGEFFDLDIKNCTACPLDTYNTATGVIGQCTVCPDKTYTVAVGSKNITQCLAACQAGEFSPTGLANCEPCPINSYQSLLRQTSCIQCPGSSVSLAEGTKSISGCGMPCAPGTYSQTGVEPCLPCPQGTYQPSRKQTSCLLCEGSKSTYGLGASSPSQCIAIADCASNPCNNDATCVETAEGYKCTCPAGFTGANCEIDEDECVSSPCAKGATCVDKVNGYVCLCAPDYTGVHCDVKSSSCSSGKCASGSTCSDAPEGHICVCPDGYEGTFCETKINDCKTSPCQNGGTCVNELQAFKCTCPTGFSGNLCEINDNGCLPDSCLNGATCTETSYGHECTCAAGFAGSKCEVDINECSSTPCQNNGLCVDQTNGYKCYCKPSFKGTNCETEISTDFDMEFSRALGRGSSIVEMRQELRAFTVAFWMKVAESELDPGTPISYAVQDGANLVDNALVIHDYNGFNIWVNGQKALTNVAANDGKWHHMAFTWESSTGAWQAFKDGSKVRSNDVSTDAFQTGQVIASGGSFVLGQEQDEVAKNFSANEAFIGKMSQMNVWSYVLSDAIIADMGRHADNIIGNVIAWSDFYDGADDGIKKTSPSVARTENKCWTDWLNNDSPTTGDGDAETRAGACSGPSLFDCQDIEGRSMPDLELNLTSTCSDSGITCLNSDQRVGRSCPDFKVRFVCTCPANTACSSNPCGAHGTCQALPVGYKCVCDKGYEGLHCDTALKCPCPGKIAHGKYSGSRALGGQMTVHCDAGYQASSTATLNCVEGKWDGPVPQCVDVDECSSGAANCGQTCVNTDGSYKCTCQAGYSLNADGTTCSDINECSSNNGNCQQSCHNSVGSYRCTCASGYALSSDSRSCEDDNECSSNNGLGPCQQICVNTLLGRQCLCRPGYTLNADGTSCAASSCPAISSLANGNLDPANPATTVDSKVRFACNVGYILRGASTRTCLADDTWSGKDPRCDVVNCILPGDLQDGTRSTSANSYNTVVTYTCNSGFRLVGSATRTCQADGTWSGEHPRCIAADCPEPTVPSHGTLIGLQRKNGDTIRFECDVGYELVGQSYAICTSGAWNAPSPSCSLVNCGAPPAIANGQIHGSDFSYNAKVTFSCNAANFKLSGSQERTCQADGTWSGTQTYCLENSCGDPGTPANGIKVGESYQYHDVVQFQCNEGYQLVGSSSRTCQTDNNWDGTQPTCQLIDCGDPGTPANGERLGSEFTYGKTVVYDCDPGYQLSGDRSRTCQLDGTWSGSVASCAVSVCGASFVDPSGSFSSPNNPNSYPDNAYCRWKISVPSGKKVMVTFNSFKTQANNDGVEIYDGVSKQFITKLSGVYSKAISFTSENNAIDIRFITDGSINSEGFSASYQTVTCGGVLTDLEQTVMSPNYPSDYPTSVTCVWSLNIGIPFQLEFESFHTESGYDLLQGYSSLSSFTQNDLIFDIDGERFAMQPIQAPGGQMYLKFTSNYVRTAPGFKATTKKYQVIVGK